jgi:triacylglycerol esterase/lipase EstA (alpha/beta hydrolase family)
LVKRFLVSLVALGAVLASVAGVAPAQAGGSTPVLIVGGLTEPQAFLDTLQGRLENAGFTVFTMQLPGAIPGTQDIALSAQAVAARARQVLSQTGAAKLDVVGHSEGGLALRYYVRNLGGAAQVLHYVSLATPQHGTQLANIIGAFPVIGQLAGALCTACAQMAVGSSFLAALDSPTDVPAGPTYTALATRFDEAVIPAPQASFLQDGGTNASVQQFCPNDVVFHIGMLADRAAAGLTISALRGGSLTTSC